MRKMKGSGIEWIGEIPEGWELIKAKYLFSPRNEKGNSTLILLSPTQKYGVIPQSQLDGVVQVKESTDLRAFKTIHIGDFVISLRSFQGGFEFSNYEGVCFPAYQVFHATKDLSNDFFRYLFKSDGFISKINSLTVGIREGKNIQYWDFSNMLLAVPPKEVQSRSAQYLNTKCTEIDTMLSKTRSSIEEYKKLKQAVITQAVTKAIYDDFGNPSKFRKLRSLCDVLSKGTTPKDIETQNDEFYCIRYLKSENIVSNQLNLNPTFFITAETNNSLERSKLNSGDILFVIAGASIGKVAITTADFLPANTNQAVAFIRLSSSYQYATKYIWYFLQSDVVKQLIALSAVQSAQPNLSLEDLGAMRLPLPDQMGCLKITDYLDAKCAEIDRLIAKKEQLVKELESYKKSLIYEVVTGKREV